MDNDVEAGRSRAVVDHAYEWVRLLEGGSRG